MFCLVCRTMACFEQESPYSDLQWKFCSEHYFLWGSWSGHYIFVPWPIMTSQWVMTLLRSPLWYLNGAWSWYGCISWCYNSYWCCYNPHLLRIITPNYGISILLIKSLKLHIEICIIKTKVVRHKNKNQFIMYPCLEIRYIVLV